MDHSVISWINSIYDLYPIKCGKNHVMRWNNHEMFVIFKLEPSILFRDTVEIKWIESYPKNNGLGKRAIKELQTLAKNANIALSLYPLENGNISQNFLKTFYNKLGFKTITSTSNEMIWSLKSIR